MTQRRVKGRVGKVATRERVTDARCTTQPVGEGPRELLDTCASAPDPLHDLCVRAGEIRPGRRAVAEPGTEHIRVDRQRLPWVTGGRSQLDVVVPLLAHPNGLLDLEGGAS